MPRNSTVFRNIEPVMRVIKTKKKISFFRLLHTTDEISRRIIEQLYYETVKSA